jgi:transposase
MPPGLIPADFIRRHDLWRRLYLDPFTCLTPRHVWAPLTDAEWAALVPLLEETGCGLARAGRPGERMEDVRGRLDAIFRAVMLKRPAREGGGRAAWSALPPEFGKADTVARTYRRWAHRGLWLRLLAAVATPGAVPALQALAYRACCAVRRGIRIMGLKAIMLARKLRLFSALPAPSPWLPDPELSEIYMPVCLRIAKHASDHPGWWPPRPLLRLMHSLHAIASGRARIRRDWEPA